MVQLLNHSQVYLQRIGVYDMNKVFMDGGSGSNLIFASTLCTVNRSLTNLWPSDTTFHDIVPGKPAWMFLGKITLDVRSASRTTLGPRASRLRWSTGHLSAMPY
jgi:hypothetical protein